ncbi:helix-turn-helix transcriptional regulator [Streptomyces nojiriensis]|uniref:helix-turn-helix transcriptional regulator n=1 Tax=Streptomyces nojiriensis TaxID=66374 RepID=UPI003661D3A3
MDELVLTRRRQIGENIRAARRRAHLTQEEVARRAGIERHTLNRIEGRSCCGSPRHPHPHCRGHRRTARTAGP